jgi:RimJ/RimL family protein N-acetyltransferase
VIESARLRFRPHEPSDEPAFVAMQTDAEARRYIGRTWSAEEAVDRFRKYLTPTEQQFKFQAAILKEDDSYTGFCGLFTYEDGATHLGYSFARRYWGRGLATEAAAAFVEAGFGQMNLQTIHATVERGHVVSERILRKLGFELVRDEPLPESARIISHYALTR